MRQAHADLQRARTHRPLLGEKNMSGNDWLQRLMPLIEAVLQALLARLIDKLDDEWRSK